MDFTPLAPKASASANFATPAFKLAILQPTESGLLACSIAHFAVRPEGFGHELLSLLLERLAKAKVLSTPPHWPRRLGTVPAFESPQKQINLLLLVVPLCGPPRGIRTPDRLLKRQLLYQLSYGRINQLLYCKGKLSGTKTGKNQTKP